MKYSIIVPVYKTEKVLSRCIDSILEQTVEDYELILIEDGSPDRCGAICDEYASKDTRIQVVHQKNGGVSKARNSGLDVAKGEYIIFIDSDDYVEKDYLEQFSKSKAELIISGYILEGDSISGSIIKQYDNEELSACLMSEIGYWFEMGIFNYACTKAFSSEIIRQYKIRFCEKICLGEDTLFVMQYALRCKNIQKIESHGYHYVKYNHETLSNSKSGTEDMIKNIEFVNNQIYDEMKKFIGEVAESYIARRLAILYKNILAESLYHGNNKYKYILYLYKQFWFRKSLDYVDTIWNDENPKYRAILKTKSATCFWLYVKISRFFVNI